MQNLNSTQQADNVKPPKEYIKQVLNDLLSNYQQTTDERNQIALWEEEQDFTILGVIEMFTTDIRGYAFQILSNNDLKNNQEIIQYLQKSKIFEIPYFSQWYFSFASDYPQVKHYVETLNYLRLLIIEYLIDEKL